MSKGRLNAPTDSEVARLADQCARFLAVRRNLIPAVLTACPRMQSRRAEALADFILATDDAAASPSAEALSELPAFEEVVLDVDRLNVSIHIDREFLEDFTNNRVTAELEARLARLPDQGHLQLPDGWRQGMREAFYAWLGRGRRWRLKLAARLRGRWPVRYRTWDALTYIPYALDNMPLPQDQMRFKVVVPVWRERPRQEPTS